MAKAPIGDTINFIDEQRPFLGLRSFEEKNKSQFGGRDAEILELFGLIQNSGLSVVFGKSGIGKTSLLKAGLLPELRQNFYFPIYARIDYSATKTPLKQLKARVYQEIKKKDTNIQKIGNTTLWQYFHDLNMLDGMVTPVIILDQFEEIFTLGAAKTADVNELITELADLAENRIPFVVQQEYKAKGETVPSHYGEQSYRVVLSLREDYVARLEELKKVVPSIMENRFRVVQMTIGQALDAAVKPGKGLIDEEVAKEIIKKLPGVSQTDFDKLEEGDPSKQNLKVEPFLLSLICDRINEKRIEKGQQTITLDLVSQFNVSDVIDSFYNETVSKYDKNVERAIEDRLLTEGGFRKLQALGELQQDFKISNDVIDELVGARILRKEIRDGLEYVELIHDVLAPVIKKKRDKRIELELEAERKEQIRQARARNKAKYIRIGSGVFLTLLGAVIFGSKNYLDRKKIEKRNYQMEFARGLLKKSESLFAYDSDDKNRVEAALLARKAYSIHNDNKFGENGVDKDDIFFYESMYGFLTKIKGRSFFKLSTNDQRAIKSFAYVNENEINIAFGGGAVLNQRKDTLFNSNSLGEENEQVGALATFRNGRRNRMAVAGTFPYAMVYDLDSVWKPKKIEISNLGKGKPNSAEFIGNAGLIIRQKKSVIRLDDTYKKRIKWKEREQRSWYDSKENDSTSSVLWGRTNLNIEQELLCLAVSKDSVIAMGIDGGIVLIQDDEFTEVKYSDVGVTKAVQFHPSGEYLIMGNDKGGVFTVSLVAGENYKKTNHLSQINIINSISCSADGKWVATGSRDGTISIWNTGNWKFPIRLHPRDWWNARNVYGGVNWLSFSPEGDYVITAYRSGVILRWPIIDKLEDLISEEEVKMLEAEDLSFSSTVGNE